MKLTKHVLVLSLALLLTSLTGCAKKQAKEPEKAPPPAAANQSMPPKAAMQPPAQLPVRYQTPGYFAPQEKEMDNIVKSSDEYQIKVGATIRSTGGPQPLWDVMKRLANLKGMTVSWASDVDQTIPVDVDINATDNFYDALANLLRQADYFHEVNGKNIIVRNKTTRVFQIGIPAMKGGYTTTVGGNFLSNKDAASGTEGNVKITSADNKFDIWEKIESNLNTILQTAETESQASPSTGASTTPPAGGAAPAEATPPNAPAAPASPPPASSQPIVHTAKDTPSFVIDKQIGLITVTAKPHLLKIVEDYINNLKKHLYQQVSIEAKIIEVFLQDNSKIGLDWSSILKDYQVSATTSFGTAGQVYPHVGTDGSTYASSFVSRVFIPSLDFNVFVNALNEQGTTHILANPKLTVMNGQPAIISVGKDVAYVKTVTRDVDTDTNEVTYTAEVGNVVQGIALGVQASILEDRKIVLHLTPITTDIENLDATGSVPMTSIGDGAIELGLPQVKVREMSTMVEVNDSEMLIIGGLIDSVQGKTDSFAPGLGSIPGLKYLFGYEEKTLQKRELVILLTPRII